MAGEQGDDGGIGQAGARRFRGCRIQTGVEQHLQDVCPIPPDAEPHQPMGIRPRVCAALEQRCDDVQMPCADRVVQRRGANAGIALCPLGRGAIRISAQALDDRGAIAEIGKRVDIGARPTRLQRIGNRVVLFESRRAIGRNIHQQRREMTPPCMDVRAAVEQHFDHRQPPPIRGFPKHRAPVRPDAQQPIRPFRKHAAHGFQIAAPRSRNADLQKIADLSGEKRHGFSCSTVHNIRCSSSKWWAAKARSPVVGTHLPKASK